MLVKATHRLSTGYDCAESKPRVFSVDVGDGVVVAQSSIEAERIWRNVYDPEMSDTDPREEA